MVFERRLRAAGVCAVQPLEVDQLEPPAPPASGPGPTELQVRRCAPWRRGLARRTGAPAMKRPGYPRLPGRPLRVPARVTSRRSACFLSPTLHRARAVPPSQVFLWSFSPRIAPNLRKADKKRQLRPTLCVGRGGARPARWRETRPSRMRSAGMPRRRSGGASASSASASASSRRRAAGGRPSASAAARAAWAASVQGAPARGSAKSPAAARRERGVEQEERAAAAEVTVERAAEARDRRREPLRVGGLGRAQEERERAAAQRRRQVEARRRQQEEVTRAAQARLLDRLEQRVPRLGRERVGGGRDEHLAARFERRRLRRAQPLAGRLGGSRRLEVALEHREVGVEDAVVPAGPGQAPAVAALTAGARRRRLPVAEQRAGELDRRGPAVGLRASVQDRRRVEAPAAHQLERARQRQRPAHPPAPSRSATATSTAAAVAAGAPEESIVRNRSGSRPASARKPSRTFS